VYTYARTHAARNPSPVKPLVFVVVVSFGQIRPTVQLKTDVVCAEDFATRARVRPSEDKPASAQLNGTVTRASGKNGKIIMNEGRGTRTNRLHHIIYIYIYIHTIDVARTNEIETSTYNDIPLADVHRFPLDRGRILVYIIYTEWSGAD